MNFDKFDDRPEKKLFFSMMSIKAFFIVLVVFSIIVLFSTAARAEHSVGFAAGSTRGVGVTYRYLQDEGPWGLQVTGLPIVHPGNGVVSLGGQAMYILNRGKEVVAYASLGIGALATWNKCGKEDFLCEDESHWGAGVGPGIGFELRMLDNIAFSVDVPLALLFADGEFHGLLPVPNAALVYFW